MTIFNALNLIGGLCLFLFGMNLMGQALERRAGSGLRSLLEKMTQNRLMGLLAGLGVTAVIQSSSATTVMVVGFVNSGLMTLRQSIGVIMGANIGTTVTAWILSLSGIEGSSLLVQMFKPSTFTPILALVGIILYMFCKADKKKDTGMILLGFATLMFGMEAMSSAVSSLRNVPQFREIFQSYFGCFGRRGAHWHYPVQLGIGGYPSGAGQHGAGHLWCRYPYHYGTEYRHLCYSAAFFHWHQ